MIHLQLISVGPGSGPKSGSRYSIEDAVWIHTLPNAVTFDKCISKYTTKASGWVYIYVHLSAGRTGKSGSKWVKSFIQYHRQSVAKMGIEVLFPNLTFTLLYKFSTEVVFTLYFYLSYTSPCDLLNNLLHHLPDNTT